MNGEQHLLIKLAEECAEIAQIALKSSIFGLDSKYLDNPTNRQLIFNELNDLLGVVSMLNKEFEFGFSPDFKKIDDKKIKINHFRDQSIKLGLTTKL